MDMAASSFVILATALCGLLGIVLYHVRRLPMYKAAARFPGPPVIPLIGNAHYFTGNPDEMVNNLLALVRKYGSPARLWLGPGLFLGVTDPEHMKAIFLSSKTLDKGEIYKYIRPWMGTGLFTAPAWKWRAHRKLISPAFNPKILETFVEMFSNQSKIMVQEMESELDGQEFELFRYLSLCTLDMICNAAMGVNLGAQTDPECLYVKSAKRALEVIYARMFKIWLQPDIIFNWTQLAKDQRECLAYLHNFTNEVIKQRKMAQSQANAQPDTILDNDQRPRRKAFLDILMESSNDGIKLTDEELREEVDTMMIAGSDSTATSISFTMLMLASHPEIQDKVYEELCEIYGQDDDRDVKFEDIHRMEYMERVLKEAMRLFPVGPVFVRSVSEDLEIGEYTFPKGSSVALGILDLHRNEEYWPNPFKFDPDRFLPGESAKRHPYCYAPFSAGPRNCPGMKYAMLSMKTLLATVLRKYTLKKDIITPIEDIKLKAYLTLQPMEKIKIRIERRKPTMSYI